jgi:hypothetical protein
VAYMVVAEAAPPVRAVPTNEPDLHGHPQQGTVCLF